MQEIEEGTFVDTSSKSKKFKECSKMKKLAWVAQVQKLLIAR
jgi:hypothetical protein